MPSEKVTVETAAVNLKQQLGSTGILPPSTKQPGCVLSYLALLRFLLQAWLPQQRLLHSITVRQLRHCMNDSCTDDLTESATKGQKNI